MSLSEEIERNKIAALLQAIYATKYIKEDKLPCQIEEGLFMGSVGAALSKDSLKSLNITHVLIVAKSLSPAFPNDFIYRKIDVLDTADTNLSEHFDECFDFINEAKRTGGNVLVHCFAGISRSGTIVVAYLMKQHGMDLCHALEFVRSKRQQVQPNHGFMIQLQEFEKSLRSEYSDLGRGERRLEGGGEAVALAERMAAGGGAVATGVWTSQRSGGSGGWCVGWWRWKSGLGPVEVEKRRFRCYKITLGESSIFVNAL